MPLLEARNLCSVTRFNKLQGSNISLVLYTCTDASGVTPTKAAHFCRESAVAMARSFESTRLLQVGKPRGGGKRPCNSGASLINMPIPDIRWCAMWQCKCHQPGLSVRNRKTTYPPAGITTVSFLTGRSKFNGGGAPFFQCAVAKPVPLPLSMSSELKHDGCAVPLGHRHTAPVSL